MRIAIAFLCLIGLMALTGCDRSRAGGSSRLFGSRSGSGKAVTSFGNFPSPDGGLVLSVSKREISLVDYRVVTPSGRVIYESSSLGSDAMRWFLVWESPTVLWAYGTDFQYFERLEFFETADGPMTKASKVTRGQSLPGIVWKELPPSGQKEYPVIGEPVQ